MNTPRNIFFSVLLLVALLLGWEYGVKWGDIPAYILPPPSDIGIALYRGTVSGLYFSNALVTLLETLLGFLLAVITAFVFGSIVALNRYVEYFVYPYIVMFQAVPKVALVPLILVWFGLGLTSKVVSAAMVAFFALMVNIILGLRSADEEKINLMRSLAATEWQIFRMLRLPSSLPYIAAGIEVALIFSLLGAIVGELVGAQNGLGVLIESMNTNMDIAGEFSVLLLLSLIGLILNRGLIMLRRRLVFWDVSANSRGLKALPKEPRDS
jgi:NitT/TauT family transport system permease protein